MLFNKTKCVAAVPMERKETRDDRSKAEKSVDREAKSLPKEEDEDGDMIVPASLFFDIYDDNDGDVAARDVAVEPPGKTDEVTVAKVLCSIVAAGLSAVELPSSGTVVSLEPHITRSMGNSLAQLLTNRAVLTAFALGGEGGGSGCSCAGEVDTRRRYVCPPPPPRGGDVSADQYDG